MPSWSAPTQAALSAGYQICVLFATETSAAGGSLKGFAFTPQATSIVVSIFNNCGQALALYASPDNVNWLPVTTAGAAVIVAPGYVGVYTLGSGLNYRLSNAAEIVAGGTVWVAR